MPGHPFLHKIARDIEERGGEQWFFGEIADGVKLKEMAEILGCSRSLFYQWFKMADGRWDAWQEARQLSAHSIVEDTDDEVVDGARTPAEAQALNTRVRFRMWLAGKFNREAYGEDKTGPAVVLNIGSLHTDALRARAAERSLPAPKEIPVLAAVVVDDD